jgi:protein-L-isoaspartate O-methyltransferase
VGDPYGHQELIYLEKTKEGKIITKKLGGVIFVPLRGKYGFRGEYEKKTLSKQIFK